MKTLNKAASQLGKKRWEKVSKEKRSKIMKKVRKGKKLDLKAIKLKIKPQEVKEEFLKEIANQTEKGLEFAVLLSLSDGSQRTKPEIQEMVEKICMVSALELNRRKGLMEVSENFDWFTDWSVKMKEMECPNCEKRCSLKNLKCPTCKLDFTKLVSQLFPSLKK